MENKKSGIIRELFSDDKGNLSSMRILSAFIIVTVVCNWMIFCFKTGQLISFDYEEIAMLLGVLGGKIGQKAIEKKEQ